MCSFLPHNSIVLKSMSVHCWKYVSKHLRFAKRQSKSLESSQLCNSSACFQICKISNIANGKLVITSQWRHTLSCDHQFGTGVDPVFFLSKTIHFVAWLYSFTNTWSNQNFMAVKLLFIKQLKIGGMLCSIIEHSWRHSSFQIAVWKNEAKLSSFVQFVNEMASETLFWTYFENHWS